MTNANVRIAKLQNNGNNTENYFSITFPNGVKAGETINFKITLDNNEDDEIKNMIKSDGYISNGHLFRRWVMAQMFDLRKSDGFNTNLSKLGYKYQFKVIADELSAMAAMQNDKDPEFEVRQYFWRREVIAFTLQKLVEDTKKYVSKHTKFDKKHHIHSILFTGRSVDRDTFNSTFTYDMNALIKTVSNNLGYSAIKFEFNRVMKRYNFVLTSLNKSNYRQNHLWRSAFKGAGAYYTLQNMFRYHNAKLFADDHYFTTSFTGENAFVAVDHKRKLGWEDWQFYALMEKVIEDNDFKFSC